MPNDAFFFRLMCIGFFGVAHFHDKLALHRQALLALREHNRASVDSASILQEKRIQRLLFYLLRIGQQDDITGRCCFF